MEMDLFAKKQICFYFPAKQICLLFPWGIEKRGQLVFPLKMYQLQKKAIDRRKGTALSFNSINKQKCFAELLRKKFELIFLNIFTK